MGERDGGHPAGGPPKRRWKLWHLAMAVLVSALVFGAIRAIARESNGATVGGMTAAVLILASGASSLAFVHLGRKLQDRATGGLTRWAVRRGGVVGFCAWAVGIGLNVGITLGAIVLGPVATTVFLFWVLIRLGRL
jgi:hypothetical protein